MDELLAAAAEALGAPASMVERSAAARAAADGVSVEDVLRSWSGGGAIAAAPATEAPAAPAAPVAEAPDPAAPVTEEAPAAAVPAGAMDEAAIVAAAAEKMGMPESMVKRSAAARAKAEGVEASAVLMEWAGVEASAAPVASAPAPAPAAPVTEEAPAAAVPAGAMDEAAIVAAAAEKMGMPESMVKRSAAARAKAEGVEASAVLMEWAGVEASAAAAAPVASAPAPAPAVSAAEASTPAPAAAASPAEPTAPDVEILGVPEEPPELVREAGGAFEPEEDAIAAGALPRWLAALFVVIPAFAIAYALFLPNGPNCGDAGRLAVDPVTGLAANCDGSMFGADTVDLYSQGEAVYANAGCVACHGPDGAGVATFPAFTGGSLLSTFPEGSCSTQIDWISLGTTGWPDATYGATSKPVGGSGAVMPAFESILSAEERAAVAVYERVAFGGEDLEVALSDCTGGTEESAALGG